MAKDFAVSALHSGMTQDERNVIMRQSQSGSTRILITTDGSLRGIDIQPASLVINYDLPSSLEEYIHRICHSRHFFPDRKGVAINFVTEDDMETTFHYIMKHYKTQIEELPMNIADMFFETRPGGCFGEIAFSATVA
eukprot:GHVU01086713.1.p1 GENE.GHVU01086713.1~~GHVU01086713.1.p1  ORF type:complete len:158 (-),score=22.52 GHVU01086713.1:217-627(-)